MVDFWFEVKMPYQTKKSMISTTGKDEHLDEEEREAFDNLLLTFCQNYIYGLRKRILAPDAFRTYFSSYNHCWTFLTIHKSLKLHNFFNKLEWWLTVNTFCVEKLTRRTLIVSLIYDILKWSNKVQPFYEKINQAFSRPPQ